MSYIVRDITKEKGWNDFLSIPFTVYQDDPNWVAPQSSEVKRILNASKNPYFANATLKIFICYLNEKPVSRSILVINHLHWEKWSKKSAFFGFFESINDSNAVKCLFDRIEDESRNLGAEYLEGPFNPNHYSELGILIDNFKDSPLFFETYNPPFYSQLLLENGYTELCRFHTRINKNISANLSKEIEDSSIPIADKNITIRKFNIWKINRDLKIMREINNDAFENNWPFLPLTWNEYKFSAKFMFFVTAPQLILITEYKGQPVGLVHFVVNFNQLIKPFKGNIKPWNIPLLLLKKNRCKELIAFTFGVKKAFHNIRIPALMVPPAIKIIEKYSSISSTWISDENKSIIHICELVGMQPYKHFGIYSKQL